MTESYDPYANVVAEIVNGIIKNEFELERYARDKEVLEGILESIFIYNNKRPHMSCDMLTLNIMHLQDSQKIKTYKKEVAHK